MLVLEWSEMKEGILRILRSNQRLSPTEVTPEWPSGLRCHLLYSLNVADDMEEHPWGQSCVLWFLLAVTIHERGVHATRRLWLRQYALTSIGRRRRPVPPTIRSPFTRTVWCGSGVVHLTPRDAAVKFSIPLWRTRC
jgi:hypothetical protein